MGKHLISRKNLGGGGGLLGSARPPTDYFFLLAPPRSGSTWLQQTLDTHPDIACLFEPTKTPLNRAFLWLRRPLDIHSNHLVDDTRESLLPYVPLQFHYCLTRLDKQLRRAPTRLTGAKIVFPQLFANVCFSRFFIRYREARYIILDRSCTVDAMCSGVIATRSNVWNSATPRPSQPPPFAIDPAKASEYIRCHILYRQLALTCLRQLNARFICLTYEHMMANKQEALASVAAFLGVSEFRGYSRLQKLMVRPYCEIVTNYSELLELERTIKQEMSP